MIYHFKTPKLKSEIEYLFSIYRGDRAKASDALFASVQKMRDSQTRLYLLEKVCRQLIHEHARARRETTPREKNLMEYPVCTSKYLADATYKDIEKEIEVHITQSTTNGNKANFFEDINAHLYSAPDGTTVSQVLTESDLDALYKIHIKP